jgi:hypothetical protein
MAFEMSTVSIDIDSRWVKRARSPLYWAVAPLQGVAITFAPLFLFQAGKGQFHKYDYLVAGLCFASILLVGFFYVRLGNEVIRELRNKQAKRPLTRLTGRHGS